MHGRETFKRILVPQLLELWLDLIWENKMSDAGRVSNAAQSSKHEAVSAV